MIRYTAPEDLEAIIALVVEAKLFGADETDPLAQILLDYFAGRSGEGHRWLTDEASGEVRGAAYYAPAPFSDGAWDLLMIVVKPDFQKQGRGRSLLDYVEAELRTNNQRILLVDTSGLLPYMGARAFYAKNGFEQEARIRDFYAEGDDKIVFRKAL